jgi:hypothetical protein
MTPMPSPDDVEVLLHHTSGSVWVSLYEWIHKGPGARPQLRPVQARDRRSRQSLPLKVIPLAYRNSVLSRALVKLGMLESPWRGS